MKSRSLIFAVLLAAIVFTMRSDVPTAEGAFAEPWNPNPPPPLGATDIITFEAGSLIIPMDGCYQRPTFMAKQELDEIVPVTYADSSLDANAVECNADSDKDDGLVPTYTLVQRLLLDGVPVSWSIRAGKTGWHDYDFSITRSGGSPVLHRHRTGVAEDRYGDIAEIRYAGAPFIIAAEDASDALTAMAGYGEAVYDDIDIHVAQVAFDAPIFNTLDELPKLAVIDASDPATDLQNEGTNKLLASIDEAGMTDLEGVFWERVTIPEVNAGALISGGYVLAWVPPFDLKTNEPPTPAQLTFFAALDAYADAGGNVLAQDGAVAAFEGYGDWTGAYVEQQAPTTGWQSNGGVHVNGTKSTWDNGDPDELAVAQDYSDPASQFGGIVWTGIGGSKYNWKPRFDEAYHDGVRRMIYSDSLIDDDDDDWDFATWRHKDNDQDKGRIYYLGGDNWRRVTAAGFRVLMNTIFVHTTGVDDADVIEAARSAPIVAVVDDVRTHFQGTFVVEEDPEPATTFASAADADTFEFPDVVGHLRAVDEADAPDVADDVDIADIPVLWDGYDGIPAMNLAGCVDVDATCRAVFTTLDPDAPDTVWFTSDNVEDLRDPLGVATDDDALALMSLVLAGIDDGGSKVSRLGGIDRSTMAVIEPSPVRNEVRPTMVYVGGRDGMLHAFCADDVGDCVKGTELWAYIPRGQLPLLRLNEGRVDGSPRVADVFGDFGGANKEFRTILTLATGSGDASDPDATPAVFALDVTDPFAPEVVWEYETPGNGLTLAMGPVSTAGGEKNATFVQTNLKTGGPGMFVAALDSVTGEELWSKTIVYPDPRGAGNPKVPATAIPGGVGAIDLQGQNTITHLVAPSLYGELFLLDASNGSNPFGGDTPLFRFDEDFHPVGAPATVYFDSSEGQLFALIVTGGYADSSPTSWSPANENQFAVAIPLDLNAAAPLDDSTVAGAGGFRLDLGVGQRAFAQAVIAGNELFIVTDSEDINTAGYGTGSDTGTLHRYTLDGGSTPTLVATTTLQTGAASVDVDTATQQVHAGATPKKQTLANFDSDGTSVELTFGAKGNRRLWLRVR